LASITITPNPGAITTKSASQARPGPLGDPQRGLALMSQVPLDGVRWLTDAHLICLASRCSCRAAVGDIEGARRDRDTIHAKNPEHLSLLLADAALSKQRTRP
jgi:hypothetical protein